ncbi:Predicted lipid-binding transport protein, Tim44 family [Roseovarius nanhaiticus]|uniref:Predicted lipid-binding transport protein, Tim44 family n=1 Tax=Roseovarius nanhaiticus TaxID=573024 RepID=A0A1N7EHR0_9RHOB|nr:Tim44/TimA family putative adaptor protein [Roseovarius nanhaiticus]SEK74525.1 Predicted lipid-binding transport protein, Tim44 family [Roseovarius nanhaiticus]SIR87528.1 Predicted lipid-binding transport protein, Tim44 family [Roseovarius nanhaiticus]
MNSPILQLLVLAGIAVFLILRLRSVLGTRGGHEPGPEARAPSSQGPRPHNLEVIEGGPDRDIIDHVPEDSESAAALADMKRAEPTFGVSDFLGGARGAYEMILMAFERGEMEEVREFLSEDVYDSFAEVVAIREEKGLTIDAEFIGIRDMTLSNATFNNGVAAITVKFVGELISVVKDDKGEIIEGEPGKSKKQKDVWTFERMMGADDPNWRLVATGE